MSLERWRPFGGSQVRWEGLTDVQQEMNRLFDSFFGRPATMTAGDRLWVPLVDMYETKDDLHIAFEVPGVREKEVSVSIKIGRASCRERGYMSEGWESVNK